MIDPLESDEPEQLRAEILRLRGLLADSRSEAGELEGQVNELKGTLVQYEGLGQAYDELLARHEHLLHRWPLRFARRVRRVLRPD